MKEGDKDIFLDGASTYSEYEMDMSPTQQEDYMRENMDLFKKLYNTDPLVDHEKLSYPSWLKMIDPERIKLYSEEYDDTTKKRPFNPEIIISNDIMKQADKHWGGEPGVNEMRKMLLGEQ